MSGKKRIICIGNGLAALNLALHLNNSIELVLVSGTTFSNSNSNLAKGGIAIPVNDADVETHINDTMVTGDGLSNWDTVNFIVKSGSHILQVLEKKGFVFDKSYGREGGHSVSRIRHVGDETGRYLTGYIEKLVSAQSNVKILAHTQLLDLWMNEEGCRGVLIADKLNNTMKWLSADAVVIASGGCGNLYERNTNGIQTNGEAYSIANRAGAKISGLEFMQFHPTMLFLKDSENNFLITEAFRGAGAIIQDRFSQDLMQAIHPLASLAPRDIVSRSMFSYMREQQLEYLNLAYSAVPAMQLQNEFPALYQICVLHQFLENANIPVTPAAHYMCGGIETNLVGQTSIPNLFAIGEAANTGLHGANRLASNSLLELFVVSETAANYLNEQPKLMVQKEVRVETDKRNLDTILHTFKQKLQQIMWEDFGIVRNGNKMRLGSAKLQKLLQELQDLERGVLLHSSIKQHINQVETALLIAKSAIHRRESRGCHFREDFPDKTNKSSDVFSNLPTAAVFS